MDYTKEKAARKQWLDMAKGVVILMVVICHNGHYMMWQIGPLLNRFWGTFDMPFFFVCSGLTFNVKPIKTFINKSAKKLLLPYLCTAGIMTVLRLILQFCKYKRIPLLSCIISLLCGYGYPVSASFFSFGALWFLTAIFLGGGLYLMHYYIYHQNIFFMLFQ